MPETRDWKGMRDMMVRLLEKQTGDGVDKWNARIRRENPKHKKALQAWLQGQGVTGYARSLLVMERFGYPDFFHASADELVDAQYRDRPQLRPIYDAIVAAAIAMGEVVIQARKTYVSLLTPKRTFARIQPTTRTRVDLGLRLEGAKIGGRLKPSTIQESMKVQVGLASTAEVDTEVLHLLEEAYRQNCEGS